MEYVVTCNSLRTLIHYGIGFISLTFIYFYANKNFLSFQNVQAMSTGVPSKIKAVKVFDDAGVELTDVVVTNSDDPPEVSKKQKTEMQMQIQILPKTVPQR